MFGTKIHPSVVGQGLKKASFFFPPVFLFNSCDRNTEGQSGSNRVRRSRRTFVTRDERFGPALEVGRNDGAVTVRQNVLRLVKYVFPAVGTGL